MMAANSQAIVDIRQRMIESQVSDARAAARNASLLQDLEASLHKLKRRQHTRLAQEARVAHADLGEQQLRLREAQVKEVANLRAELAEVQARRSRATARFQEELDLREAVARSKQQLQVELELERFDDTTREALRTGAREEVAAAEGTVQVARPLSNQTLAFAYPTRTHAAHGARGIAWQSTMAAAVVRAAQETQDAIQAQVSSQIRWIADDLPAVLRQQAEKALHQLGGLQPTGAADGIGARPDARAGTDASGTHNPDPHPLARGSATSPATSPARQAAPLIVERPFWALSEADVPSSTTAEEPSQNEPAVSDTASHELSSLDRARSNLLAAAQRAEQARRSTGGVGWGKAQTELLHAAEALVSSAGALTASPPPGMQGAAAWQWNALNATGPSVPPWAALGTTESQAMPPWAAPAPPWGAPPSCWPMADARSAQPMPPWAVAAAVQHPEGPRPHTAPPLRHPTEPSYGTVGHASNFGHATGTAGRAEWSEEHQTIDETAGCRSTVSIAHGGDSPRLLSPCAYSPSTFDAPAPRLPDVPPARSSALASTDGSDAMAEGLARPTSAGRVPSSDAASVPANRAGVPPSDASGHGGRIEHQLCLPIDAAVSATSAPSPEQPGESTKSVAASRPNFATRSKAGGFFNKNSTFGAALQARSAPSHGFPGMRRPLTGSPGAGSRLGGTRCPPSQPRRPTASAPTQRDPAWWRPFRVLLRRRT